MPSPTTTKTWAQLVTEIEETMRKWRAVWMSSVQIISPYAQMKAVERRKLDRAGQTPEQRAVTLTFEYRDEKTHLPRTVSMMMMRETTALANLDLLAKAVEHLRMADVRNITNLVVKFYRQLYPTPAKEEDHTVPPPSPPPPQERVNSNGPYAVLHLANDAPLAICEAAYRVAIRDAHPDTGGNHETAKAINAAIALIRAQHSARTEARRR